MKPPAYYIPFCFYVGLLTSCKTVLNVQPSVKDVFFNYAQKLGSSVDSFNNGNLGLLLQYKEDTLNRNMLVQSKVKIEDISIFAASNDSSQTKSLKAIEDTITKSSQMPFALLFCKAKNINDTLILSLLLPFNQKVEYKITKKNVKAWYQESYKNENIVKVSINDPFKNHVEVDMLEQQVIVNDNDFLTGKTIYGRGHFTSHAYYVKDSGFKGGYLKKQIFMEYLFHVKISD